MKSLPGIIMVVSLFTAAYSPNCAKSSTEGSTLGPYGYEIARTAKTLSLDPIKVAQFCQKPVRDTVYLLPQEQNGKQPKALGFFHLKQETLLICLFRADCHLRISVDCEIKTTSSDCYLYAIEACIREQKECIPLACDAEQL